MIIQHKKGSCEKGLTETGVIKNTNGNKLMFRVRQVGPILKVNPPPEDMCCEICGRNVYELEAFDRECCELFKIVEEEIREFFSGPQYKVQCITFDHKLVMVPRPLSENLNGISWECCDCFSLSKDEASKRKLYRNQHR